MVRKQASGHLVNAHPLSLGLLQRGLLQRGLLQRGLLQRGLGLVHDDVPLCGRYRRYR